MSSIPLRPIEDVLAIFKVKGRFMEDCKRAGFHLGVQEDLGPASGRYNPRHNIRCEHCDIIYEGRPGYQAESDLTQKL